MVQLGKTVEKSLLSTFNKNPASMLPKPPPEPKDVTALPLANSDDDSADEGHRARYGDSSDDDGLPSRGDIVRSEFRRANPVSKTLSATNGRPGTAGANNSSPKAAQGTRQRRSTRQDQVKPPKKRWKDDIEDDEKDESDERAPIKKTKVAGSNSPRAYGGHMGSGWLVERNMSKEKKPVRVTYARRGGKSRGSTPQKQFISAVMSSPSVSPERPKFKTWPSQRLDSSPVPEHKPSRPAKFVDSETSPLAELDSEALSDPPRPLNGRTKQQRSTRRQASKSKKKQRDVTAEPISQKPEFKMPEGYNDYTQNAEFVELDTSLSQTPAESKRVILDLGKALCPMCEEQVDEEWLKDFSKGQRMTIARQAKFCRMHKRRSAKGIWEQKGYPEIDWGNLETRIRGYHDYIESLIRGKTSHFGMEHQENIKTGQNRTLLKTEDYLTPGYYGLRGMSLMTETIVVAFSSLLRERAPRDKLISARGHTGFVQSVLVPELAVKLIQSDMSLGADEAREVMRESRGVGEILNDERRESPRQTQVAKDQSDRVNTGAENSPARKVDLGDDEIPVRLKIQEAADSDSDLSSIASIGGKRKAHSESPVKTHAQEIDDSDSDLSSVGDW